MATGRLWTSSSLSSTTNCARSRGASSGYERRGHTLNTTALVHEAYLKLVQLDRVEWQSRAHFLAIAARCMRKSLSTTPCAGNESSAGEAPRTSRLQGGRRACPPVEADRILALDAALERLAELNPRHARIVECRFFGGMTIEETATALEISPATVKRDWALLRIWLGRELEREP